MASPQKENGYTPIANEIMEALVRTRINGESRQVLDHILRQTYGWNKKEDAIALSQFYMATKMKKPSIQRAIKHLIRMNIISEKAKGLAKTYCLVKDFEQWKPLAKKLTVSNKANDVSEKAKKFKHYSSPQKTKENIQKQEDTAPSAEVAMFIDLFSLINPSYQTLFAHPPSRRAVERLLKLHPIDYWKRFMAAYQSALEDRFCPRATTPIVFEKKLGDIEAYGRQRKAENIKKANQIVI